MYSIVLLTALSSGADVTPPPMSPPTPAVVAPAGCCGVVVMGGCTGYSGCYGSCYGSCHGCRGGGFLGLRAKHSCHGCTGCYGSCFGCLGSCHGCHGVSYGSSWGPPVTMLPYTLHGYNSAAVYGVTYYPNLPPTVVIPVAPMTPPSSDTKPMGANLKFTVPAETKLFVDGKLAPGSGTERAFYTPALEPGKKFFYDVKAELVVNGQTVTEEKKVIVEAGKTVNEEFAKITAAATAKPAGIAGK